MRRVRERSAEVKRKAQRLEARKRAALDEEQRKVEAERQRLRARE